MSRFNKIDTPKMKLNARLVDISKPKEKPYKLADGGGLYLLVHPSGARYWRLKYRIAGKEKLLAVGVYPDTSLADARAKREEAKRTLASGGDPSELKQAERQAKAIAVTNSFELLALEWHNHKKTSWSQGYTNDILESLKKDIFPYIGKRSITDIKPFEMLAVLKKMEQRGVLDKLKKVRQACRQIFTYAIVTARAEFNPVTDLARACHQLIANLTTQLYKKHSFAGHPRGISYKKHDHMSVCVQKGSMMHYAVSD